MLVITNFEVVVKIDGKTTRYLVADNIEVCKHYYNKYYNEFKDTTDKHIEIYIYDYNKNAKIEHYDNRD